MDAVNVGRISQRWFHHDILGGTNVRTTLTVSSARRLLEGTAYMETASRDYVTGDIFTFSPPRQTLKGWEPFWDCVGILFQFQNSDVADGDEELPEWRLYWVAGIALLRTIGHVLAKVDAGTSAEHSQAIGDLWRRFNSEREDSWIFWEFIEKERNNLLKTYSFGAQLAADVDGYYVSFADGQDAFQLFRQAVYWWRHQLMELEEDLSIDSAVIDD